MKCFVHLLDFGPHLHGLLSQGGVVRVSFATDRGVRGYPNGLVETNRPNLSISVDGFSAALARMSGSRSTQLEMLPALAVAEEAGVDLVFIYTGVQPTEVIQTLQRVRVVREGNPLAIIVIVTCTCGADRNRITLGEAFKKGLINYIVFNDECGGKELMATLLEKVIELKT